MPEQPAVIEMLAELRDAVAWLHDNGPQDTHLPENIKALQLLAEIGAEVGALRDVFLARIHQTVASGPKGGVEYDLDGEAVKVAIKTPPSRTKIQHDKIFAALEKLADLPQHRVDAVTGEDIGRAAARLKLERQCSSPSWRWAELEHLGLKPSDFCTETTDTKIAISGAVKLREMRVPKPPETDT